jgi:flagellar hook-basal body complex protein FliE
MSSDSIQSLQQQMKVMAELAGGQLSAPQAALNADGQDFASALQNAVMTVNQAQNTAQANVQDFTAGKKDMDLEEVMVSVQKANLSFQTMIAVRNRLVEAYKEVTNLQV